MRAPTLLAADRLMLASAARAQTFAITCFSAARTDLARAHASSHPHGVAKCVHSLFSPLRSCLPPTSLMCPWTLPQKRLQTQSPQELNKMGKGKGQAVAQFDLATALTKKETRLIRKAEYMIPYHMARCPAYGWKESEEYARAEELKEKIAGIEAKAKKRWEANFC